MNWSYLAGQAAEMKDVREAMLVVLVVVLTFVITIIWAKRRNKNKR